MATRAEKQDVISVVGSSAQPRKFPSPTIAKRDPTPFDQGWPGQQWINTENNSEWVLTSITLGQSNWINSDAGNGTFTAITIDPGDLTLTDGSIQLDQGGINVDVGNIILGQGDIDLTLGNLTLDAGLILSAGNITSNATVFGAIGSFDGLAVNDNISADVDGKAFFTAYKPAPQAGSPLAIPDATFLFSAVFTAITTAAGQQDTIVFTNANITTTAVILATATNVGANGMAGVVAVKPAAGSVAITIQNFGGAALDANVTVNGWILQY